ncbi:MAG: hypothetical protein K9H25_17430 [Rhodospirillum sp.]|nr:hypothetical protein [Rhodospirillum sp.]MCF8490783.1 hypothetical protein [Rhodospirillum sp.]MCF8499844.1 hypothetical protein [Rhodospirillum sp.]
MDGIVVFLNGDRGLHALRALVEGGHGIAAVVIPPGRAPLARTITGLTAPQRTPVLAEANINAPDCVNRLRTPRPTLFLIAGFSTLFHPPLLSLPTLGTLNLHAGRVPEYRGGSPLNWQIINGESEVGLSILLTGEGLDDGPVIAETRLPLAPEATIATLHDDANTAFGPLILKAIERLEKGDRGSPQDDSRACYWHQRGDQDGQLRPDLRTATEAYDFVRALTSPYPGAWVQDDTGVRVRLLVVQVPDVIIRGQPGRICRIHNLGLFLVCKDRAIQIIEARAESEHNDHPPLRHGMIVG